MSKKRSFWEKYAHKKIEVNDSFTGNELHILSEEELAQLKTIRSTTYLKAGIAGALGIILLYVPYHIFGETLFPSRTITLPYFNIDVQVEIEFLIFTLVLVFIEIWYLTYININAVSAIANACGFPRKEDQLLEGNIRALVNVGIEKKQKDLDTLGINPYAGLSKVGVWLFYVLVKLKAAISSVLWKILVSKILGRFAFRALVDLFGAPLYAVWNIYAARKVMNEARVRVMAPSLIDQFTKSLQSDFLNESDFKKTIYNGLHLISTSKRSYHNNHFLLASSLIKAFDIDVEADYTEKKVFLKELSLLSEKKQEAISRLIVFGIIIDGNLNFIEKRAIAKLQKEGVIPFSMEEIKKWSNDYFEGKGLEGLV